ncbi:extracellular solute-binding protein [Paenibacillus sp. L3-i20]|uniref:extracellular solute-binding protein n=1 Tax=Paenibacillus sp. L3-i20 TaxID=2905833 RepID=UPI001EDDEB83|nr:extracellular solute-binding protein [Paenibacillus sp. L3-i20]GKU77493.1 putative ABC transporter extracellular-binding protein YurO [Paenibacillus sp. L3-i20]
MKKRLTLVVTLITLISLLVAACGDNKTNTGTGTNKPAEGGKEEKVKLTVWHNFAGDDLRAKAVRGLIDEYKKANPNVELDAQAIPVDGYRQRLSTVAAANEMPDVFFVYAGSQSQEFFDAGLLQPITPLAEKNPDWKNNFMDGAFDRFTFEPNQIYSAPIGLSATSFLYYNKDLFEQNGVTVPTTWAEMMTAVKVFNEKGITPIALGNKAPWVAQSTIIGSLADRVTGTDWFMKAVKGEASFEDKVFVDALGKFKELADNKAFQEGANSIDNTQAEQYFVQGKAAMMVSGAWTLTNLAASATAEQVAPIEVTTLPTIEGGAGEAGTISGGPGAGFALSKKTSGAAKDAALDLIYAISGPDGQKAIAESNSMVMYKMDLANSKVSPLYLKAFNVAMNAKITPVYDAYLSAEAGETINNGLQELMMGGKPEDVAKKVQEAQARSTK